MDILDIFNTLSFHALEYKYTVMPASLPKVSEKVLLQTIFPGKKKTND